ncbi:MAG: phosphotransferase [Anaerolineae bacterium]|nr:phosphotransferase [Anaerolineae bacterium]
MSELAFYIRLPKPSYVLSQLSPRQRPSPELNQLIHHLAEIYQLGEIQACYRAPRTNSLNFFATTPQGKFVIRRQNLSETAVAYEFEILSFLLNRNFPAPRMRLSKMGQAWANVGETRYSVYEFIEGYAPANFVWWPGTKRKVFVRCGRVLGEYHRAITGLEPAVFKWNGYRPGDYRRWQPGDWFRQAVAEIRSWLQKSAADQPIDDFARTHLDDISRLLDLEETVESRTDLSKLVIHGDYAPWNVLFRSDHTPLIIDFNESRLDLKIYDLMLATFWFAWRNDHLDADRALALQAGYSQTNQLNASDLDLAGPVFRWVMGRSLIERLYHHYDGYRKISNDPAILQEQYTMCVFAKEQPHQLIAGLKG